jgi:hypothetical protein
MTTTNTTTNTNTKAAKYSDEDVKRLVSAYKSADTDLDRKLVVINFADALGKTTNSIIAKLSGLKVYKKPEKVTKNGSAIVRKSELVNKIADAIGEDAEVMESLEKATKIVLEKILAAVSK